MEGEHVDRDAVLTYVWEEMQRISHRSKEAEATGTFERKLVRGQTFGTAAAWVLSLFAAVFSAGIAWSVFMGANATDAEVVGAIVEHNGGLDPRALDDETRQPYGHHPDLRRALKANADAIYQIRHVVMPELEVTQKRLDKRSEYQFELGRWQAAVFEAERRRQRPPAKPERLDELERELMLGNYE